MSEFKNTLFEKDYAHPAQKYFQPDTSIGFIDSTTIQKSDNDKFIQVPLGRRIDITTAKEFKEIFGDPISGYGDITDDFMNTTNSVQTHNNDSITAPISLDEVKNIGTMYDINQITKFKDIIKELYKSKEDDRVKSYFTVELDLFKNGKVMPPEVAKYHILKAIRNANGKIIELIMPDKNALFWFVNDVIFMLNNNHRAKLLLKKGPTWDGSPSISNLLVHVNTEYLAYAYGFRF